jgi:hypothetical protein
MPSGKIGSPDALGKPTKPGSALLSGKYGLTLVKLQVPVGAMPA